MRALRVKQREEGIDDDEGPVPPARAAAQRPTDAQRRRLEDLQMRLLKHDITVSEAKGAAEKAQKALRLAQDRRARCKDELSRYRKTVPAEKSKAGKDFFDQGKSSKGTRGGDYDAPSQGKIEERVKADLEQRENKIAEAKAMQEAAHGRLTEEDLGRKAEAYLRKYACRPPHLRVRPRAGG